MRKGLSNMKRPNGDSIKGYLFGLIPDGSEDTFLIEDEFKKW